MRKHTFDAKRAIVALKWNGIDIQGIDFDLLIALIYLIQLIQIKISVL